MYMNLDITGDTRTIANSAWISTQNEVKAKKNTQEKVIDTVNFLIKNDHTSPLESVTLTFIYDDVMMPGESALAQNIYARQDSITVDEKDTLIPYKKRLTIDLLNFLKTIKEYNLFDTEFWKIFQKTDPELASHCKNFKSLSTNIVTKVLDLGEHSMAVELIQLHDTGSDYSSRATWRIKCPLSIAVQILRHRKGSFNMVSGRYRTIKQHVIEPVDDCQEIFEKCGYSLSEYLNLTIPIIETYEKFMIDAKTSRDNGMITNDEYKRAREFARFILPEGRMTELYVTYYLDDFINNYLPLRDSIHAQDEHIWVAEEMKKTLDAVPRKGK